MHKLRQYLCVILLVMCQITSVPLSLVAGLETWCWNWRCSLSPVVPALPPSVCV